MWGEDPRGIWTLLVESISTNVNVGGLFFVFDRSLESENRKC